MIKIKDLNLDWDWSDGPYADYDLACQGTTLKECLDSAQVRKFNRDGDHVDDVVLCEMSDTFVSNVIDKILEFRKKMNAKPLEEKIV